MRESRSICMAARIVRKTIMMEEWNDRYRRTRVLGSWTHWQSWGVGRIRLILTSISIPRGFILKGWKSLSPGLRGTSYPGEIAPYRSATLKELNQIRLESQ